MFLSVAQTWTLSNDFMKVLFSLYSVFSSSFHWSHHRQRKMVGVILWILCNVKSHFGTGKWIALPISLSARRQCNFLGCCNSLGVHTLWGVYGKWQIRSSSLLGVREMHSNKHEKHKRWNFGFATVRTPMTGSRDSRVGTWWLQNSTFFWGFQGLWGMLDVELIPEEWKLCYKWDMKTSLLKDSHVVHSSNFNGVVN